MFTTCAVLLLASAPPVEPVSPAPVVEADPLTAPVAEPPASLAAPLYRAQDEPDEDWHGTVGLGATITSGNSDIVTASASAGGKKEWDSNRVTLKGSWSFAQQEDTTTGGTDVTQRQWRGMAKYDRFFDERDYGFGSLTLENDDIAFLNLRSIYSVGVGRKFKNEEDLKLDGEVGLAFVDENYVGKAADDEYFALRLASDLDYQVSENTKFLQTAELYPSLDFSEFNSIVDSRLKINMTDATYMQIQWITKYNNNAPPGTGSTDNLWILSLGWEY